MTKLSKVLAGLLVLAALAPNESAADDNAWIREALRQQREWDTPVLSRREARRRAKVEWVPVQRYVPLRRVPEHYEPVRPARWHRHYDERDWGRCHGIVPAAGEQAQNEEAAFESALTAWRGAVRFLYGERYTKFDLARDPIKACAPSSIADSARDKTFPPLYRCRLSGRPCAVQPRPIHHNDD